MDARSVELAIETSSRHGSVTLAVGGDLVDTAALEHRQRHNVELMPLIAAMFSRHGLEPGELGVVHVSIGPGSFTGLRVGIATAQALAHATGCRLTAVPTLDVLAWNLPAGTPGPVGVCCALKRERVYACRYARGEEGRWARVEEPGLLAVRELVETQPRAVSLLADVIPPGCEGLPWLDPALAQPRSEAVLHLGRAMAGCDAYTDRHALQPLYVRPPEAVELWQQRSR